MEQKELSERQQKWINKLQDYNFKIDYAKGKNNALAYAISRVLSTLSLMEILDD